MIFHISIVVRQQMMLSYLVRNTDIFFSFYVIWALGFPKVVLEATDIFQKLLVGTGASLSARNSCTAKDLSVYFN